MAKHLQEKERAGKKVLGIENHLAGKKLRGIEDGLGVMNEPRMQQKFWVSILG